MNITPLFSNFLGYDYLNLDNTKIKKTCIKIKNNSVGRTISNSGGWQSNNLDFQLPEFKDLFNQINEKLLVTQKKLELSEDVELKLLNYWVNINSHQSYNKIHDHFPAFLSGIYYISVSNNSGNTIFYNPNVGVGYSYESHKAILGTDIIKNYNIYNSQTFSILPESGKLLLFPGYLKHSVETNTSNSERITLSFNIVIRKK